MSVNELSLGINIMWVVLIVVMILLMEGGFVLLEVGFVCYKNSVNIIMKVFVDIIIGMFCFYLIGFGLMYGDDLGGVVGKSGFVLLGNLLYFDILIGFEMFWLF